MNDSFEKELEEKCAKRIKAIHDYDITNSIEKILGRIYFDQSRIKYLEEENKKLKDEQYKDNELLDMKAKLEEAKQDVYRGFPISKEEMESIKKWMKQHTIEKHNGNEYVGAIGGNYSYHFIPTSIGTIGIVRCSCGEEFEFQSL